MLLVDHVDETFPGVVQGWLGSRVGIGCKILVDDLGIRGELVIPQCVEGGNRASVGVVEGRALEERPLIAHELATGVRLEVEHEHALDGR